MDWDDFRYLLAVSRAGSALRAARALGVNQTTVLRRLDALEAATGARLLDRKRSGHTLTPVGELAAEAAAQMEREAQRFTEAMLAARQTRTVRLTTSEILAGRLVAPCLVAFRARHPDVSVELITGDERLDLARGEADVALRAGSRPEGSGIVARRMPDGDWTVYCSRAYAAAHGAPADREAIAGHEIIGMEGRLANLPMAGWLAEATGDAIVRFRSNSLINLLSNLKAGLGVGGLPTLIGDVEPELVRCFPPPPELRSEMWLIVREQMKDRPHVRAFTDFLAAYVRKELNAVLRAG